MKIIGKDEEEKIIENIFTIAKQSRWNYENLALQVGMSKSIISKLRTGKRTLSISDVAKFATAFDMSVLDLLTYPDRYVKKETDDTRKVMITFEVSHDMRDRLLSIVTNNKKIK